MGVPVLSRLNRSTIPTTRVFGNGAVRTLANHVKRVGAKRALVVCDAGVAKVGIAGRIRALLEEGGVAAAVFDRVDPNPVEKNVSDGVEAFKAFRADVVVSVGGGSPLDAGKLIALKTTHARPLADYDDAVDGGRFIGPDVPPILTIPTTAGTGSAAPTTGGIIARTIGRTDGSSITVTVWSGAGSHSDTERGEPAELTLTSTWRPVRWP